jgi:hypothetical protein
MGILDLVALVLVGTGFVLLLVGYLWFIIRGFNEGMLWGLGIMFVPFVALIFLIVHFDKAWQPVGMKLAGLLLLIAGAVLGGGLGGNDSNPYDNVPSRIGTR